MQSNRRRLQAGQSIAEAVVASAMLGITIAVALGAIDASIGGGRQAVRQAWAQCMVRETTGAIKQASWAASYGSPDPNVLVSVAGPQQALSINSLQTITVTASDPVTRRSLYTATFLKAAALQGTLPVDGTLGHLASACPRP
jgi:hypothetical protein